MKESWNEDPSNLVFPASMLPEFWKIDKEIILSLKTAAENGLEYAKECLIRHDQNLGRTTRSNKREAEAIEADISQMKNSLERLENYEYPQNNPQQSNLP